MIIKWLVQLTVFIIIRQNQHHVHKAASAVIQRFLARKTSLFTLLGLRLVRRRVAIFPEELKTRSDGELVAHTAKYFLANLDNVG